MYIHVLDSMFKSSNTLKLKASRFLRRRIWVNILFYDCQFLEYPSGVASHCQVAWNSTLLVLLPWHYGNSASQHMICLFFPKKKLSSPEDENMFCYCIWVLFYFSYVISSCVMCHASLWHVIQCGQLHSSSCEGSHYHVVSWVWFCRDKTYFFGSIGMTLFLVWTVYLSNFIRV